MPSLPIENLKGFLDVPEDWTTPSSGKKIRIFFYSNFAKEELFKPSFKPTFFFEGGPGADSHNSYFAFNGSSSSLVELTGYRQMIFMDARGTGCSGQYPSDAERVVKYGSRSIVKDAEAVRAHLIGLRAKKLGSKRAELKWQILGHSFGGYVAYRYLTVAPEGLLRVFVHGAAIVDDWQQYLVERLAGQRRVLEKGYFTSYPGDKDLLLRLRARLRGEFSNDAERADILTVLKSISRDDPIQYEINPVKGFCFKNSEGLPIAACGDFLVDGFVYPMATRTSWPAVHQLISDSIDQKGKFQPFVFGKFMNRLILPMFRSNPLAVQVIWRHELTDPNSKENICAIARKKLEGSGFSNPAVWPINECRLNEGDESGPVHIRSAADDQIVPIVDNMTKFDPLTLTQVKTALQKNPKLEIFVFSGGLDAFFPSEVYGPQRSALGDQMKFFTLTSEENGCGLELAHGDFGIGKDLWAAIDGKTIRKSDSCN